MIESSESMRKSKRSKSLAVPLANGIGIASSNASNIQRQRPLPSSGQQQSSNVRVPPTKRAFGRQIVLHRTPDVGWAWVVVVACFSINAIIFGIYRTYGVLYVAVLKTYDVSREQAAWPFSLCLTVFHMTGLVSGALSSYYTTRVISVYGCLIAAIGFSGCFWATTVTHVSILIGIVIGFGYGLIGTQTPVIINQYFTKYRATASGIALAGGTVGSFIFPPLVKIILTEYTLRGCFLILGGIVLNTLPVALLLRPPIPSTSPPTDSESSEGDVEAAAEKSLMSRGGGAGGVENDLLPLPRAVLSSVCSEKKFVGHHLPAPFELSRAMIISGRQQEEKLAGSTIGELFDKNSFLRTVSPPKSFDQLPLPECTCEVCSTRGSWSSLEPSRPQTWSQKLVAALQQNAIVISKLLRNPLFIILCTTQVSFTWGWTTYSMVIVDFAVDRGVDISSSVTLLSAFAGSDLIGRLGSGWISDKGFIKRRNVAFSSILAIGILLWMLPIAETFPVLLAIALGLGLFSGSLMILFSILLVEYVGIETMPVALGTSTFCCGVATLVRPVVIGYFRDHHGSYDGLFRLLGIVCMLVAILWLVEPCAQLWQERKERLEKHWVKIKPISGKTNEKAPTKKAENS